MKTLVRSISSRAVFLMMLVIVLFSCKKEEEEPMAQYGEFNLRLTDAPAAYLSVNVDIIGAEVHHADSGWINIPVNAGVYDLLLLQNGVSVALTDSLKLPIGQLSQMRLLLGNNNTIVTAAGVFDLKVPSGSETGLKVNLNQNLQANKAIDVLLDFDAGASVVEQGNGLFLLKPVVKLQSVVQL